MMTVQINGIIWMIFFVPPNSSVLLMQDDYTLGVTDIYDKNIYIADDLGDEILYNVLTHELTHAWTYSYGYDIPISCDEIVCQIVEKYSDDIQDLADYVYDNL